MHTTRLSFIAAGCLAALSAMLLIPNGKQIATADASTVSSLTSNETIAAIDAMLIQAAPIVAPTPSRTGTTPRRVTPPAPQTTEITKEIPATPAIDPSLRADAIGRSAVNLRAGPSSSSATVTVLQPGQSVHVGMSNGGWVEVTLDDGSQGFVYARYLASSAAMAVAEPTPPEATETRPAATETGPAKIAFEGRTVRIEASIIARSLPAGTARQLFTTEPGERVRVTSVRGDWLQIETADGSSGWIRNAG